MLNTSAYTSDLKENTKCEVYHVSIAIDLKWWQKYSLIISEMYISDYYNFLFQNTTQLLRDLGFVYE